KKKSIELITDNYEKISEKITNKRTYKGKTSYLVTYKGLDYNENTWIDEEQITDRQLIQEYNRRTKTSTS
ncbi:hypothetical protein PIROE2DRAFT_22809, partial [Piromyces sp. E2]